MIHDFDLAILAMGASIMPTGTYRGHMNFYENKRNFMFHVQMTFEITET